jgi:hypothetical protein
MSRSAANSARVRRLRQRGKHIGLLVKPTARASTEHISLIAHLSDMDGELVGNAILSTETPKCPNRLWRWEMMGSDQLSPRTTWSESTGRGLERRPRPTSEAVLPRLMRDVSGSLMPGGVSADSCQLFRLILDSRSMRELSVAAQAYQPVMAVITDGLAVSLGCRGSKERKASVAPAIRWGR